MMRSPPGAAAAFGVVVLVAGALACGASPAMRAAEHGEYAELQTELVAREAQGAMSNRAAAELARVIASREIALAAPADALVRVHEVRACANELDDALADRMKTPDEAGAEAASIRLEDGRLAMDDARSFASAPEDGWRAVGTRALTRTDDRTARLRAILDPSPAVRRGAIRAMVSANDGANQGALFEVARVDPEPLVRSEAVRAMAKLASPRPILSPTGVSSDLANRLRDLWVVADDGLREDIAAAWASPHVFAAGGREALRVLLASEDGPGVIAGAGAVLRAPHAGDPEIDASARAVLVRAIESSARRNRLHAIAVAPLAGKGGPSSQASAALLEATRKASHDEDPEVRLSALARLTERPADRADAIHDLETVAGQHARPELASRAEWVLATAGDARIQAWIESDLGAPEQDARLAALSSLGALGVVGRGAPVLADPDPSVRTRAACTVLSAARVRR